MSYTSIPNTDVDAESPITESLMTQLRDNPVAIANADAGADEPPRIIVDGTLVTGASAIAATNAAAGDFLQVVSESNPGTGQSGLLVRPVAAFGDYKVNVGQANTPNTATCDLNLGITGFWSLRFDCSLIDSVPGTQPLAFGYGTARFENNVLVSNQPRVIPSSDILTVTNPSSGVVRITYDAAGPLTGINDILFTALRWK